MSNIEHEEACLYSHDAEVCLYRDHLAAVAALQERIDAMLSLDADSQQRIRAAEQRAQAAEALLREVAAGPGANPGFGLGGSIEAQYWMQWAMRVRQDVQEFLQPGERRNA